MKTTFFHNIMKWICTYFVVWDYLFSIQAKFIEKLKLLTPWYSFSCVRIIICESFLNTFLNKFVITSSLFNPNCTKHVRLCRIKFRQILKSFSTNLPYLLQKFWKYKKNFQIKEKAACVRPCIGTRKIWTKEN